jgi:hypothetical protein
MGPPPGGAPMGPEGGPEAGGPPAAPGGDIEGMLMEYAQSRDPELAVAICDALVEMLAAQGGGPEGPPPGGPEMGGPEMGGPPPGPGGPPMGRFGMKLRRGPVFRK